MITLTSYYYDLVTPSGELFSGHSVDLQVMGVSFPWRAAFFLDDDANLQRGLGQVESYDHDECYHLVIPAYNLKGEWQRSQQTELHHLLRSDNYRMMWQGLALNSAAKVSSDQYQYEGKGYVEKLVLIFKTMNVPYHNLYWGRFIAHERHCHAVWIKFDGEYGRTLIIDCDGIYNEGELTQERLSYNGQVIHCTEHQMVVDTTLGEHIPPWIKGMFPGNLSEGYKKKWLAKGEMIDREGKQHQGWVIEESFHW